MTDKDGNSVSVFDLIYPGTTHEERMEKLIDEAKAGIAKREKLQKEAAEKAEKAERIKNDEEVDEVIADKAVDNTVEIETHKSDRRLAYFTLTVVLSYALYFFTHIA